ncbi:CGNR zinc finger domain-containing protein [Herbidospora cretacea]|uniref:CGNR zinc finger domain-containing protein n=1 Tax=Herbidospora cretacea TaxID=28444 RepID=UPI0004C34666|nr:CGNR zinc finger domain-containing protein [Herbidospora cretacea]
MGFVFVSGRRSLDFAGTRKWRRSDAPEEQLRSPADLSAWVEAAGLLDAAPAFGDADLAAAIDLREAVYRTASARLDDRRPEQGDVTLLNDHASRPGLVPTLLPDGSTRRSGTAGALLATLAADLLDLLAAPARVKRCANTECTRLYVDTSRAENRQWCGMSECGNRAKVRAFRRRHRER